MSVAVAYGPLEEPQSSHLHKRIVFFDGVCGFCNAGVDFVMRRDPEGTFCFAPLQGETARQLLSPRDTENLNSLVLWVDGRVYRRSAAVVRIAWRLGLGWRVLAALLWLIPLPLRDLGYWGFAKNRYRWFGKRETCRMPTSAERSRILP